MKSNAEFFWYFVGLALSSPMNILGSFLLIMLTVVLTVAQFGKSKIDLTYLLVDSSIGNVTLAKFAGFGAFLASTWVFIDLTVTGHFDSGYAFAYVGIWAGAKVGTDYLLGQRDHKDG